MDTKIIRHRALNSIRTNWSLSVGVAIMAWMLAGMGGSFLPDLEYTWNESVVPIAEGWAEGWKYTFPVTASSSVTVSPGTSLNLARLIIGGVIQIGYCIFLLNQHDGKKPEFNTVFSQFDRFGTGFAQKFLRDLYVILWSMLLIIPGIIAGLSYAMTPFILAEHPEMTASEAIARSKEMMDGHKADLFLLHLTFIGWDILAALTFNIGHLWLNPYKNAADAAFYRELQNSQANM